MKLPFFILLLQVSSLLFAQETGKPFGEISKDEFSTIANLEDKDAEAIILSDVGESIFFDTNEGGYNIRFTRTRRIIVNKKEGERFAEVSIPYYEEDVVKSEKIVSIEASTYKLENGVVVQTKLNPSTIYDEKLSENWRNKKFVFPNTSIGAILEYKYVLESPFHFNLPDWSFQDKIPTIYSQYTVRMIPFYEYVFIAQGISKFDYQDSYVNKEKRTWGSVSKVNGQKVGNGVEFQDYVHTYVMKNVPAFKDESFITSINDYIMKIDFQLAKFHSPKGTSSNVITTWTELNKELLGNASFGKFIKSSKKYAKQIVDIELDLNDKNKLQICEILTDYVKTNFVWNGQYGKYASKSPKELITEKTGSVADLNLFLFSLLEYAGVEAYPVILSTRNHGKVNLNYPFSHQLNYIIPFINVGDGFFVDATEPYLPFNMIPPRCINEKGLVVQKDRINWVNLYNSNPVSSQSATNITRTIDIENHVEQVNYNEQIIGYDSYSKKLNYSNDFEKLKSSYKSSFSNITSIETLNYQNNKFPYTINVMGEAEYEEVDNNILIYPFLNLVSKNHYFTQKTRIYPVDIVYPFGKSFNISIDIPNNYEVARLPENYEADTDVASINLDYNLEGNLLSIKADYNFKKSIFTPEEYDLVKFYFKTIADRFNESLILRYKSN